MENTTMTLSQSLADIMGKIGAIPKSETSQGLSFKYRGIDAVMNKLNPLLASHGVTLQSKINSFTVTPRTYKKWDKYSNQEVEKTSFYATVHLSLIFTKGSEVEVWEEPAMSEDSSDKAVTQAASMAFKYAILRKFCILTEDVVDPDGLTPDRIQKDDKPQPKQQPKALLTLVEGTENYTKVVTALKGGGYKVSDVETKYTLTPEMKATLLTLEKK